MNRHLHPQKPASKTQEYTSMQKNSKTNSTERGTPNSEHGPFCQNTELKSQNKLEPSRNNAARRVTCCRMIYDAR